MFVDPPQGITPEALLAGPRIQVEYTKDQWFLGLVERMMSDRKTFRIKWDATAEHEKATTSVEQLLPLGGKDSLKFKVERISLAAIVYTLEDDAERKSDAVRRSVCSLRSWPSFI